MSGSSGLVGRALIDRISTPKNEIRRLVRPGGATGHAVWDPAAGKLDPAELEGIDAIVHLAGENIAAGRWSDAKKTRLRASRVDATRLLCESVARLASRPKTLVCASAVGIYGNRGDEWLDETSSVGDDFLATLCRDWEAATRAAEDAGVRVVCLRFGVILARDGGALAKMLLPFRMGVGGIVGDGRQYVSWITLDDAVGAIEHALGQSSLRGPANAVTAAPVTNHGLTKALGRVLHRPTVFPLPAFAARLVFGEVADALLLASQRVRPTALEASGFRPRHAEIESALRHVLDG